MSASPHRRWLAWQATVIGKRYLHPRAAQRFSVVPVPPRSRAALLAVVELFLARQRFESQYRPLPSRALPPDLCQIEEAWQAWSTWTRRLAAYMARRTEGQAGTIPDLPDVLKVFLEEDDERMMRE